MNLASDAIRDDVAETIVSAVGALFSIIGVWVLVAAVVAFLLWRVSLIFGPEKVCWRCHGKGSAGGWFGGLRVCDECQGSGRRPRVGAK